MTLTFYNDFQELFENAILFWNGANQTNLGFPILPSGVTVTPNGSWTSTNLGNNRSVMNFDGSTNYISLSDNDAWTIYENNFTISGWIKGVSSTYVGLLMQYASSTNYCSFIWDNTTSKISLFGTVDSVNNFNYTSPLSLVTGIWYHITIVRSDSNCLIYINGISQTVTTVQAFRNTTNLSAPLIIGGVYSNSIYTTGNIKDLLIYKNRALTQPEITTLMKLTEPGKHDITPLLSGIRGVE